jgi:hypothetical protein
LGNQLSNGFRSCTAKNRRTIASPVAPRGWLQNSDVRERCAGLGVVKAKPFRLETSRRIDHEFAAICVIFAIYQLVSFARFAETKVVVDKELYLLRSTPVTRHDAGRTSFAAKQSCSSMTLTSSGVIPAAEKAALAARLVISLCNHFHFSSESFFGKALSDSLRRQAQCSFCPQRDGGCPSSRRSLQSRSPDFANHACKQNPRWPRPLQHRRPMSDSTCCG